MHGFKSFIASILLAGSAYAQYGDYGSDTTDSAASTAPSATSSATSAGTTVHVIKASNKNGDLTFSPNSISANPGDMVQWQFYPKVSRATQSHLQTWY